MIRFTFLLFASIFGGFVTAFAYTAVVQLTLPPEDEAYGQSVIAAFNDPFVRAIACPIALISGLLASPLLIACLWRKRLAVTLPIVFGSVLVTVAVLTPFSHSLGWSGAYAALVISCIACARIRAGSLESLHDGTRDVCRGIE